MEVAHTLHLTWFIVLGLHEGWWTRELPRELKERPVILSQP